MYFFLGGEAWTSIHPGCTLDYLSGGQNVADTENLIKIMDLHFFKSVFVPRQNQKENLSSLERNCNIYIPPIESISDLTVYIKTNEASNWYSSAIEDV